MQSVSKLVSVPELPGHRVQSRCGPGSSREVCARGDTIALFMIKPSELLRVMAGLVPHLSRQAALT